MTGTTNRVKRPTRFAKVPRLDKASLAAPDFEMLSGKGIMGLRDDMEFLAAKRGALEAGQSFKFKLDGLPFERPIAPWAVLGFALVFAAGVLVFGRREQVDTGPQSEQRLVDVGAFHHPLTFIVSLRRPLAPGEVY